MASILSMLIILSLLGVCIAKLVVLSSAPPVLNHSSGSAGVIYQDQEEERKFTLTQTLLVPLQPEVLSDKFQGDNCEDSSQDPL